MVAADWSCDSRLPVAVLSAVILLLSAMDPVLSSTSATRRRAVPHFAVDCALSVIELSPKMLMTSVGTDAVAVTTTEDPPVDE